MQHAVRRVQPIKMGPAIKRILPNYFLKMYQSAWKALSNMRAGMKISRMKCGSSVTHWIKLGNFSTKINSTRIPNTVSSGV